MANAGQSVIGQPVPTVTPYLSPAQGGNRNVPVGQTGTPYGPNFIGPIQQQYGQVGAPVSFTQFGTPTPQNNSTPNPTPVPTPQQNQQNNGTPPVDPYAGVRNDISNSWDSYLNSLQGTSGFLNDQQTAQNNIADSQYNQGVDLANNQKAQSLRDIANTTRNAFSAGNNYLGSLGAGDSSAANQYAFAINQTAGKQTGDLNNYVSGQIQGLKATHDQQINQVASWFANAQENLKQQIAQGGLQKGQDLANLSKGILDQAMAATNAIKANTQNQYNALLGWAANNSSNMGQLQQNIANIPQAMGHLNTFGGQSGPVQYGGAPANNQKTDLFGNPVLQTT